MQIISSKIFKIVLIVLDYVQSIDLNFASLIWIYFLRKKRL
jgi:hypothetical protein